MAKPGYAKKRIPFRALNNAKNAAAFERFIVLLRALDRRLLHTMECKRCDASVVFEQFMLRKDVWGQPGMRAWDGMLYIDCTENRHRSQAQPGRFCQGSPIPLSEVPRAPDCASVPPVSARATRPPPIRQTRLTGETSSATRHRGKGIQPGPDSNFYLCIIALLSSSRSGESAISQT